MPAGALAYKQDQGYGKPQCSEIAEDGEYCEYSSGDRIAQLLYKQEYGGVYTVDEFRWYQLLTDWNTLQKTSFVRRTKEVSAWSG